MYVCMYVHTDSSDEDTYFRKKSEIIFDILVPIYRYSRDWTSAVQVLFAFNLANRDFWPHVLIYCNLCCTGKGQETCGLLTERYTFVDEVAPTSLETRFFGGVGALVLLLMCFFLCHVLN